MIITFFTVLIYVIDLLKASLSSLWCILIYFMWIDIMLSPLISVDLKNTFFKQNFQKIDYLISIFKCMSATMATSHWSIKWSVFSVYIVCVLLWCMGIIYAIILNFRLEHQNISQNHKNGQTTQTSNVKIARLLWVNMTPITWSDVDLEVMIIVVTRMGQYFKKLKWRKST